MSAMHKHASRPVQAARPAPDEDYTDIANARRLARKFAGSLAYVHATGKWLQYERHHWAQMASAAWYSMPLRLPRT